MSVTRLTYSGARLEPDGLDTDAMIHWGISIEPGKVFKFRQWEKLKKPTGQYTAFKPTYQFAPKWEDGEEEVDIVNMALERCFGSRADPHWQIFVDGDELHRALKDFRDAYIKLERKGNVDLTLLDRWAHTILEELMRIFNDDDLYTEFLMPEQSALGLLEVPLSKDGSSVRRSARAASQRGSRSEDDRPASHSEMSGNETVTRTINRKAVTARETGKGGSATKTASASDSDSDSSTAGERRVVEALKRKSGKAKKAPARKKRVVADSDGDGIEILGTADTFAADTPPTTARIRKAKHTIAYSPITPTPTAQATVKPTPGSSATVKAVGSIAISSGDEDEVVAVDESRRVNVRDYFHLPVASCRGPSSFDYKCRHCFKSVAGPKVGTTNHHNHQEKCPMLLEAFKKKSAGISQAAANLQRAQLGPRQTLLDGESGKVILPFNKADFLVKVAAWIASDALAFRIVESPKLRELLTYLNPLAKLCSADTITTTTAAEYERVKDKVISMLQNLDTVVHYAYDAWTDKFRSSEHFGAALFQLFEDMGLMTKMGPGTADNASVNGAIAKALNNLIFDKHLRDLPARNLLGCMCHVANIAATQFLKEEAKLSNQAYVSVPSLSLDGEDFEAADEEWVTEDPAVPAEEDLEDEVEPDEEEELEERDADEDQQVDNDDEVSRAGH
ncbi:hypothetical protein QFC20_003699 [Naganishia adeliensis]|uniref:Uncharacterized protein n=1 Tax=Naganishia adeliensis TaxID=92952 RepID=A0ACC2W7L5_9TREE|nr:hypothetical protein QFC20_003699 [Naganishia adeliensis]